MTRNSSGLLLMTFLGLVAGIRFLASGALRFGWPRHPRPIMRCLENGENPSI